MNLIQQLEKEEIERLGKQIPDFAPGDTVVVNVNVVEGNRKRAQAYEGVVIAKRNRGLNSSFIVRKRNFPFLRGSMRFALSIITNTIGWIRTLLLSPLRLATRAV